MEQSAIISLYKSEIDAYKEHIEALKLRNDDTDRQNTSLLDKVRQLENLVGKANLANQDLHTAFNHVTEENLRLKLRANDQQDDVISPAMIEDDQSKALETVQQKYATLAQESVSWISNKEQMNQRIKFLERECGRYHRDNTTLGKQVRHLLRTLEEERGMIIRHRNDLAQDGTITCAADVIDKHLVTFESIEELQQQNQKILSLLKDTSAREEERETQIENEEVERLMSEMKTLKEQLGNVENERAKILEALNTIHKERELFKILLTKTRQVEHMTPEIFQRMISIACSSSSAITSGVPNGDSAIENEAHIEDLRSMISKLEQEISNLKKELSETRTRTGEELSLKGELLEKAHSKIIQESQRADVLNERNEVLEGNIKSLMLEFDEMRTKCHKMTFETERLKEQIATFENLSKQLETTKQELIKSLESYKQLETINQELVKSLESSKQLETTNQELIKSLESYKQLEITNQELIKSLESYKQFETTNQELVKSLESSKQLETANQELIKSLESSKQLETTNQELIKSLEFDKQQALRRCQELENKARDDIAILQHLRNVEREGRLKAEMQIRGQFKNKKVASQTNIDTSPAPEPQPTTQSNTSPEPAVAPITEAIVEPPVTSNTLIKIRRRY